MEREELLAAGRDTVLIGVDGGASGFRAHEIVLRETRRGPRLALGEHSAAEAILPVAGFAARSVERQQEEARRSAFDCTREERELRARWIEAAFRAVARVAAARGRGTLRAGICAPGVKTADGRGIELSLNGPRIPDFVDALEQRFRDAGLKLGRPLGPVASDGLACGMGEELAEGGLFHEIAHAYYLGGGSGVAECFKLAGRVLGAEAAGGGIQRAWQLRADDGRTFEEHLSVAGLNREFDVVGQASAATGPLPEAAAAAGDPRALALFERCAARLAELACARLEAVHAVHGVLLERIVIGQRLGQFFLDRRLERCFAEPARNALAARLAERAPAELREAWLRGGALAPDRLAGSSLRAAAALGALALALEGD